MVRSTVRCAQVQRTQDGWYFQYGSCEATECSETFVLKRALPDECGAAACTQDQCFILNDCTGAECCDAAGTCEDSVCGMIVVLKTQLPMCGAVTRTRSECYAKLVHVRLRSAGKARSLRSPPLAVAELPAPRPSAVRHEARTERARLLGSRRSRSNQNSVGVGHASRTSAAARATM